MATVYVVTEGSYSDYGIRAIFRTREVAEEAIALGLGEDVEEYTVHDKAPTRVAWWRARWVSNTKILTDSPDGKAYGVPVESMEIEPWSGASWSIEPAYLPPKRPKVDINEQTLPTGQTRIYIYAFGRTRDAVIKAVADRRAQWLAEQEGIA